MHISHCFSLRYSDLSILDPFEENMVADAASRYDYRQLANLDLQVSRDLPRPVVLRRKLHSFTTPSLQVQGGIMRKSSNISSPSAGDSATFPTQPPSERYRTGLLSSPRPSNPLPQNLISGPSNPSTFEPVQRSLHSRTNASTLSLGVENGYMAKALKWFDAPLHQMSSSAWSTKSLTTKKESMSRPPLRGLCHLFTMWRTYVGYMVPRLPSTPSVP